MSLCYYLYVDKIQMVKEQFEQVNKIKKNMRMDLDKTKGKHSINDHLYILFLISLDKNKELQEEVKKLNKKLLMEDETTCQQAKGKYIMCLFIIVKTLILSHCNMSHNIL